MMEDLGAKVVLFFEFVSSKNLEKMEEFLSPDAGLLFPKTQPLLGREKILKFFQVLFRRYPELKFTVEDTIVQDNRAAVHWKNRGVTRKNEPYENEGMTLFVFKDGLVSHMSDFFKDTEKF